MAENDNMQVLLVTSTRRDTELVQDVFRTSGIESLALENVDRAVAVLNVRNVGALLVAEECLDSKKIDLLASVLKEQPPWSALPVLVMTAPGGETPETRFRERRRSPLGITTLLERPVRVATLVSSVKSALAARQQQYERKLSIAALRQSEKLAAVGRLASSIAHEINNPLEAVTNLLFILESTPLDEEQRGYLTMARQELTRVSDIASQTLTFNRQRDIRGTASVPSLLDSVLRLYQGRLSGSGISIERRYQNTAEFTCYPGELRQVFANLIGNAFDATRQGGRIVLRERPALHPKTRQRGVRVTLADTGHGMPDTVKAHLFEPFKSTKGNNGSGLGLWISKGIIDKHCGTTRVRSSTRDGHSGTVFSIFIPFDRRSDPERSAAQDNEGTLQTHCA